MSEEERGRVLIVEDEPTISKLCQVVLTAEGFNVDIAGDGSTAKELVTRNGYNLLLVDIRLPIESGYDFYVWLLQEQPILSKCVIFMTGGVIGGEVTKLLKNSGRPYLLKPFRPEELINTVDEFLKKS